MQAAKRIKLGVLLSSPQKHKEEVLTSKNGSNTPADFKGDGGEVPIAEEQEIEDRAAKKLVKWHQTHVKNKYVPSCSSLFASADAVHGV